MFPSGMLVRVCRDVEAKDLPEQRRRRLAIADVRMVGARVVVVPAVAEPEIEEAVDRAELERTAVVVPM